METMETLWRGREFAQKFRINAGREAVEIQSWDAIMAAAHIDGENDLELKAFCGQAVVCGYSGAAPRAVA